MKYLGFTLKDLSVGDRFYAWSNTGSRNLKIFKVIGMPEFNIQHGSPTRICLDETTNDKVSKSCRLKVVKLSNNG